MVPTIQPAWLKAALSGAFLALILSGCGGGGGGGETPPPGTEEPEATPEAQTTSSATQSSTAAGNATQTLGNLTQVGLSGMVAAPAYRTPLANQSNDARAAKLHHAEMRAVRMASYHATRIHQAAKATTGDEIATTAAVADCGVSGSYSYTETLDGIDLTFTNCREATPDGYGEEINGSTTFTFAENPTGETWSMRMTLGNGNNTIESSDYSVKLFSNNFTNFYGSYIADMSVDVTYSASGMDTVDTSDDSYEYNFAANGKQEYNDFTLTYSLTFTDFTADSTINGDFMSGSETINGVYDQSWSGGSEGVNISYTNLVLGWEDLANNAGYDTSISGTIALDFTPNICSEGSNTLATVTPIRYDYAAGHTTAGEITINGTTTVTYNSNGSVTVDGNTYSSVSALEALCPIQDMSESTTDTNTSGSGDAAATRLLATLSWDTYSDMDLHMIYYSTTSPTSTTAPASYVNFHGMDYCQSPMNASEYWSGIDTDANGVCEAGLDYDNTTAFGPEHITATTLADGYYMIVVNSFSGATIDNATKIHVTMDVGGTLFTFPDHTFTASDGESSDPGSWHRVADMRVSGGTASVLTPNTSLTPWGAYELLYTELYGDTLAAPRVKFAQ